MNIHIGEKALQEKSAAAYFQGAQGAGHSAPSAQAAGTVRSSGMSAGYALDLGAGEREGQIFSDQKKGVAALLQDDLTSNAKAQKDFMILASNTMSPEAYGKLAEDGYDVQQMDPEETVTVVDEIKAEMAKAGVVVAGYNDDLSKDELEAITGSAAYAAELDRAFRENGVPLTEQNVKDVVAVIGQAQQIPALTDGAKKYLVENEMAPTIQNMYRALHSGAGVNTAPQGYVQTGGYLGMTAQTGQIPDERLTAQMRKVIGRAGEQAGEENLAEAKRILDLGLPLTEETFLAMSELDALQFPLKTGDVADAAARALSDGQKAAEADVTGKQSLLQEAVELAEQVAQISDEAVDAVADAELPLTIKNLAAAQAQLTGSADRTKDPVQQASRIAQAAYAQQTELKLRVEVSYEARHLTSKRQMEEIRLSMTVEVSYRMLKNGVHVDTTELSKLVEDMKAAEAQLQEAKFGSDASQSAAQRSAIYSDTMDIVRSLPGMPVSLVGDLLKRQDSLTVSTESSLDITLSEYTELGNRRIQQYAAANERYETMMTEVRTDLGDNIKEAFDRAESLLTELGIEATEENLRATRILGYNRMELTEDNMTAVKAAYRKVHNITQRMNPAATLQMIRDGVNPMQLSLDELEQRLAGAPESTEKYSEFLVRIQQKGEVTETEQASFIGIYRMLHQIEKRDGAAIGSVLAQGAELNFNNLLSAVRSYRDRGMDVSVDDTFAGMDSNVRNDIEEQIRAAYYQNAKEEMLAAGNAPAEIYEELIAEGVSASPDNVLGLLGLRRERGALFDSARAAINGIEERHGSTTADGEVVTDGGSGSGSSPFAVTEAVLEAAMENALDRFTSKEDAGTAYEHMADVAERVMADAAMREGESIDIRQITSALKQVNVARQLAREEAYELPMMIGGEQSSVSVRIRHDAAEQGTVEIMMEHDSYGTMRARFAAAGKADAQRLEGYVVCDREEGMRAAEAQKESLMERLAQEQIPVGEIRFVYSEHLSVNYSVNSADDNSSGSFDTSVLYRTAKTFLQVMGGEV
ncbi:MAG: hypothetical protein J6N53_01805 [Lachnospiraceae bacterium]|nr:hypothetical protein [Lachnospiraceae bacterium]